MQRPSPFDIDVALAVPHAACYRVRSQIAIHIHIRIARCARRRPQGTQAMFAVLLRFRRRMLRRSLDLGLSGRQAKPIDLRISVDAFASARGILRGIFVLIASSHDASMPLWCVPPDSTGV
ncbi:hypothetical protein ASE43_08290 [Lysobacter sp. Root983]|nr:hypothetical protein ASE43_08290 [Lysobacter sp. Root983]